MEAVDESYRFKDWEADEELAYSYLNTCNCEFYIYHSPLGEHLEFWIISQMYMYIQLS